MDIRAFGSGSAGNCYHISDGKTELLLEAGLPYRKIQKALDFGLSKISGCLISHSHADHARALHGLAGAGIDCWINQYTQDTMDAHGFRIHVAEGGKQFGIGSFTVKPFELQHDIPILGFLIASGDEKLVYITDSAYCRYTFPGLTHIMVEANYSKAILDANVANGSIPAELRNRVLKTHFSIENVVEFLRANDLSKVREIFLLHMSDGNGDEIAFRREVEKLTGIMVKVF